MLFELLFFLLCFATISAIAGGGLLFLRGQRREARRTFVVLAAGWGIYMAILAAVSLGKPQRAVPFGQELCFDEMCFSVVRAETATILGPTGQTVHAQGIFHIVTVRVTSHSLGTTQSEGGVRAYLVSNGRSYGVSASGQSAWQAANGNTPPLTATLEPGQSVGSVLVFDLPRDATNPGLSLSHGLTPGYLVIGESPLFRKPTLLQLQQ